MNCGLTWRGTRADVTRHRRPRGRAARAHAAPRWHGGGADTRQDHSSPRRLRGGDTWQCEGAGR